MLRCCEVEKLGSVDTVKWEAAKIEISLSVYVVEWGKKCS